MRRKVKTILLSWQKGAFDDTQKPNVLTGKICCADCVALMYNHRNEKGVKKYTILPKAKSG